MRSRSNKPSQAALDWIGRNIREAVASLTLDPDQRLKVAFRTATGDLMTNHKTGQKVGILYTAIVRLKPKLTEISLYLGPPDQIKEAFRISKRTYQYES
jgi:hypothetical protein